MNEGLNKIIEQLNVEQKQAVCADLKNLLIVAGAGTGKTTVLVSRIAYLVEHHHIPPYAILSVTFTNKAAHEMKARLEKILGAERIRYMWSCTFHSACLRILRNFFMQAGLKKDFVVIDTSDQLRIVKRALAELGLSDQKQVKPKEYLNAISSCKEAGLRPQQIDSQVKLHRFAEVYSLYQSSCDQDGQVDFSEILLRCVELLRAHEEVRAFLHDKFKQILVDEFQDTNSIQYEWLRLVCGKDTNVLIVGDDDQSIYGWRGAVVENMHRFKNDYRQVELIQLKRNYRSTDAILETANSLIKHNTGRLVDKHLITNRTTENKVLVVGARNEFAQAEFIAQMILKLKASGLKANDIAILYRTNAQTRVLETALRNDDLSYVIYGGLRFYDREEIKNALCYLQLIVDPNNNLAFERILNVPARKIGKATLGKLQAVAMETGLPLYEALRQTLLHSSSKPLRAFFDLIEKLKQDLVDAESLPSFVEHVLETSGLLSMYKLVDENEGTEGKSKSRISNLEELLLEFERQSSEELPNFFASEAEMNEANGDVEATNKGQISVSTQLSNFLDKICLTSGAEAATGEDVAEAVRLMTVHCAKGLEFKVVFVAGFEETLMPLRPESITPKELDEERRLAYVAITRAKDQIVLCYAENRGSFSAGCYINERTGVSSFLRELDHNYYERKMYRN